MTRNHLQLLFGLAITVIFLVLVTLPRPTQASVLVQAQDTSIPGLILYLPFAARPGAAATATATATSSSPPPTYIPPGDGIWVDRSSVALFEAIPDQYIAAASLIPMVFSDRSVGSNINDGLTCLSYPSDEAAPSHCQRWTHTDPAFSTDPQVEGWSRAGGYPRDNWSFVFQVGAWQDLTANFVQVLVPGHVQTTSVLSYQFSYLNVGAGSDFVDPTRGFFVPQANGWDVSDLEALEQQYPAKTFIYWTTSLARTIGTAESTTFNNQMRTYAADNDKILFDVADILSHDPAGNLCLDTTGTYPAICQHYTTESNGGHLGSVSAGKIRVAKAFWVLMAQIAGWRP